MPVRRSHGNSGASEILSRFSAHSKIRQRTSGVLSSHFCHYAHRPGLPKFFHITTPLSETAFLPHFPAWQTPTLPSHQISPPLENFPVSPKKSGQIHCLDLSPHHIALHSFINFDFTGTRDYNSFQYLVWHIIIPPLRWKIHEEFSQNKLMDSRGF